MAKLFTIFLIAINAVVFAYSVSVITEYIVSKNDPERLYYKRIKNMIEKLENHIIIVGYGRNGKQAADKLLAYDKKFVIIEKDKDIIDKHQNDKFFFYGRQCNRR
ncbi:NAD-binding protein [Aquimarina hainanensis]|uniref:NAD-binding protein n=1 Tax=Aquimarina hainanensis TaxID=1578017 RepID=UPI003623953F